MPAIDPRAEPSALSPILIDAVREAGALALSMFGTSVKTWTKGQDSPVTAADIAANDLLHDRLMSVAPGIAWLSEESEDEATRRAARRVWIVDPIDGTRGYIAGRTDWAVSAALVEDGRPVAGANTAASNGCSFSTSATLTHQSSLPAR